MSRRFILNIAGTQVSAELLEQEAPTLSRLVRAHLPLKSFGVHAKFAGQELIVMVPFYAEPENEVLNVQPGDIGYYPGRQTLCIFYGETMPFGKVSLCARVVEGLDALKDVGAQLLRTGLAPAELTLEENGVSEAKIAFSGSRVLKELRGFRQRVWEQEPPDIRRLREVTRPPMGNLPCCFYANFNLFWAGETLQVLRQVVQDGTQEPQVVAPLLAQLLERHASRLEKWQMTETVALLRMLAQYFRTSAPGEREHFLAVVEEALLALDRVQSWIDALLPWSDLDAQLALRPPL